jgi:LmbE family N-acetylglucosaminyl deacetylase
MKLASCVAATLCLTLSLNASAKRRIVRGDADPFAGTRSILWLAAHPDDDVVAAPLLASLCRDRLLRCTFVVLTRGEIGGCLLAGGCQPDVATVRSGEMGRASQFFGANLVLLNFSDGGGLRDGSAPAWDAQAGGHDKLVTSMASLIKSFAPDVVLTFDPRHGTTCHPDHRAAGNVAKEALSRTGNGAVLYFLETRLSITTPPLRFDFEPSVAGATGLYTFRSSWNALIEDMQLHRSQFDDAWVEAALQVPDSARSVYVARASDIEAIPVSTCP